MITWTDKKVDGKVLYSIGNIDGITEYEIVSLANGGFSIRKFGYIYVASAGNMTFAKHWCEEAAAKEGQ